MNVKMIRAGVFCVRRPILCAARVRIRSSEPGAGYRLRDNWRAAPGEGILPTIRRANDAQKAESPLGRPAEILAFEELTGGLHGRGDWT